MTDLFTFAAGHAVKDAPGGIPADVATLFERLTLQVAKAGHARYSADAVLHRIRWEMNIERGERDFKCNDHWTSALSRWFLARHPDMPKFFETRERRAT
jgi:hypothetical protein